MRFGLVVIGILLFFSCCTDENKLNTTKIRQIQLSDGNNTILIQNTNNFPVSFNLKINDIFPVSIEDMISTIQGSSKDYGISEEQATWLYVYKNTFHTEPYTNNSWQHHPFLFINSVGGGFCDDRAAVLARLWNILGYKSRVVRLDGHVVAEVYSDDKWKMFDPDNGIFYCSEDGSIMSITELAKDSSSFFKSNCSNPSLNPIFLRKNPISRIFAKYYSNAIAIDNKNWHLTYEKNISTKFIIPSNSHMEISHNGSNVIAIRLVLDFKSKGLVQIPFIPYKASGDFIVKTKKNQILVKDAEYFFNDSNFNSSLEVLKVNTHGEINYLVNSKLQIFDYKDNVLKVEASDVVRVLTKKVNVLPACSKEIVLFFDEKSSIYSAFLFRISEFKNKRIDRHFLRSNYLDFLSYDQNLTVKEKKDLLVQFEADLKLIFANQIDEKILIENYPKSVFYLFLASKYKKMDYIYRILF